MFKSGSTETWDKKHYSRNTETYQIMKASRAEFSERQK
jgi:hypothetical protein